MTDHGPDSRQLRLRGLQAELQRLMERMCDPDACLSNEVARRVERLNLLVERSIAWHGAAVSALTEPTREARAWLAFFSDTPRRAAYADAVRMGTEAFEAVLRKQHRFRGPVRMEFRPQRALALLREAAPGIRVSCCTPAVSFDRPAFLLLAEDLLHRRQTEALHAAMLEAPFQRTAAVLDVLGGVLDGAAGRHHHLRQAFDRVNAGLFSGGLSRPRLGWTRTPTLGVLGHYEAIRDAVSISSAMDRSSVSARLVDYVLYHELLHKVHGIRWSAGRARVHTAAFRADERMFPARAEVEEELRRLLRGQPCRRPPRSVLLP